MFFKNILVAYINANNLYIDIKTFNQYQKSDSSDVYSRENKLIVLCKYFKTEMMILKS